MTQIVRECPPSRDVVVNRQSSTVVVARSTPQVNVDHRVNAAIDLGGCPPREVTPPLCVPGTVEVIIPGPRGPKGEPGTDVGSTPTISAVSDETAPMLRGTPVAIVGGKLRRASAIPPFNAVVGLVFEAQIAPGEAGRVQTDGPMEMLQSEWEAVTGIPGSLAAEAAYYLAPAGSMSPWAPTAPGQVVAPVGRAASATEFVIDIDTQVHL